MATYTLIPSTLRNYESVKNESNAFTDTNSNTYATAQVDSYDTYLGGFDFSVIPSGEIVFSITIKAKFSALFPEDITSYIKSMPTSSSSVLSSVAQCPSSPSTVTFALTSSESTIMQSASTLCIAFHNKSSESSVYIYGAEIIVETVEPQANKVIYDGNTLIDLSQDTATKADVAVGKIFHLANGIQSTGILSPSPSVATATTSSSTAKTVSFTVSKEPSWFLLICAKGENTQTYRVLYYLYNGSNTQVGSAYYGSAVGMVRKKTDPEHVTWAYSANALTFTIYEYASIYYFGTADWELYYL